MKGTLGLILISVLLWNLALADDETDPNIFKTGKFKYFIEPKQKYTWSQAMDECRAKHMHLVSIDSKEKTDDVQIILNEAFLYKNKRIPRLYTGGTDVEEFRQFIWMAKDSPVTYTNWEKNEPNNYRKKNERCIHIGYHNTEQWNDINCNNKYGFICELALGVEDLSNLVDKA